MGNDPTDIWAWTYEDMERLIDKGGRSATVAYGFQEGIQRMNSNQMASELAFSEALEAARETGELKWELLIRHWRAQLWLRQSKVKQVLPEAIDLLSLATDDRVRDVPQRICAYHDVVDCYIALDAGGYYQEIVENSQDILSQLPQRHPCATCARIHIAHASAAAGKVKEAKHWQQLTRAMLSQSLYPEIASSLAEVSEEIQHWDEAEKLYEETRQISQEQEKGLCYLDATLGLARIALAKQNLMAGVMLLNEARQGVKYMGGNVHLARLLDVEGRVAAASGNQESAVDYMTRAAAIYLELGCYRDAARTALSAAEIAKGEKLAPAESALNIAAQACGQMPAASQGIHKRLAAFGRAPLAATPFSALNSKEVSSVEEQRRKDMATLEDLLQAHLANKHVKEVIVTLYRIGSAYGEKEEYRAAIDYILLSAILERWALSPMHERESVIETLSTVRERLPEGMVEAAFQALESGPPSWLVPLLEDLPLERWRWLVRALNDEIAGRPVVEPQPDSEDHAEQFSSWIEHVASMTSLIVRFQGKIEVAELESWLSYLDDIAADTEQEATEQGEKTGAHVILSLIRGLAALARGTSLEEAKVTVQPPFDGLIEQIGEIAQAPVWFHPGSSPIDYLVEQMAQKAVEVLRQHDEYRARRIRSLTLRYGLLLIDLREHEELQAIVKFLEALTLLAQADGQQLPELEEPLAPPFAAMLSAVYETSKDSGEHK